jgi:nucleotide-binding universal stress UspA family protein
MFKSILVPIDGTAESNVALPLARTVARETGAAISLLRVLPASDLPAGREALGMKDLPDPSPEVLSQWAMFEKFIMLMSPDGMVGVMDALTPHLLDAAMPLGMGAMMRTIGKAPAVIREPMFKVMAPMMPVLFPILCPG